MSVEVEEEQLEQTEPPRDPLLAGLLAEFEDVDSVMRAARHVRDEGFTRWDVHSPFPVHGMDEAMGIKQTILPWLVLVGGVVGAISGLALQWYTNGISYPFYTSGKPILSIPAWIPVTF